MLEIFHVDAVSNEPSEGVIISWTTEGCVSWILSQQASLRSDEVAFYLISEQRSTKCLLVLLQIYYS